MNEHIFLFAIFMSKVLVSKGIFPIPNNIEDAHALVNECLEAFMRSEGISMSEFQPITRSYPVVITSSGSTIAN